MARIGDLPPELLTAIFERLLEEAVSLRQGQCWKLCILARVDRAFHRVVSSLNTELFIGPLHDQESVRACARFMQISAGEESSYNTLHLAPFTSEDILLDESRVLHRIDSAMLAVQCIDATITELYIYTPADLEEPCAAQKAPYGKSLLDLLALRMALKPQKRKFRSVRNLTICDDFPDPPLPVVAEVTPLRDFEGDYKRRNMMTFEPFGVLFDLMPKLETLDCQVMVAYDPKNRGGEVVSAKPHPDLWSIKGSMPYQICWILQSTSEIDLCPIQKIVLHETSLPMRFEQNVELAFLLQCYHFEVDVLAFDPDDLARAKLQCHLGAPWASKETFRWLNYFKADTTFIFDFDDAKRFFDCFDHIRYLSLGRVGWGWPEGQAPLEHDEDDDEYTDEQLVCSDQTSECIANLIALIPTLSPTLEALCISPETLLSDKERRDLEKACEEREVKLVWRENGLPELPRRIRWDDLQGGNVYRCPTM